MHVIKEIVLDDSQEALFSSLHHEHYLLNYLLEVRPLHCIINNHPFNVAHRKTEEFLVAEHFSGDRHSRTGMDVMAMSQMQSRDPCHGSACDMGKQVDQSPVDLIPFGNEPQG